MLRATLALVATAMATQIATGIHLQDVSFTGDTLLDGVDLKKCANDLKSHIYAGTDWTDDVVGTVQTSCLLDKGYLKSVVTASTRQLPDKKNTHQFAVTFDIRAGSRYRLGHITFKGNHAITDQNALRALFPIKDGDICNRQKIAKGLENLKSAYGSQGYINFTSIPTPSFDEQKKTVSLEIDMDEGKKSLPPMGLSPTGIPASIAAQALPSSSRVEDWRDAPKVRPMCPSRFLQECLTNQTVSSFPVPASSNPSCRFPAMGLPACFVSRLM